eukprot:6475691-Amphidinium_carterae.1
MSGVATPTRPWVPHAFISDHPNSKPIETSCQCQKPSSDKWHYLKLARFMHLLHFLRAAHIQART